MGNSKEPVVWIIRFVDGTMTSFFGSYADAAKEAEKEKQKHGAYVIN